MSQLVSLERMREYNDLKVQEFKVKIKEKESTLQSLTAELTQIFNLLKQQKIDQDILRVNQERGQGDGRLDKRVTLFDHISDEAIIELQRQADDEIGEMEVINNVLENQSRQIALAVSELASIRQASVPVYSMVHERLRIQGEETEKMAEILTDFTKHYDQIVEATKIYQADPEACGQLDITILEDDNEHIPDILASLRDSLVIVESIAKEIQAHLDAYLKVQQDQLKVLDELDFFGTSGKADAICEKVMDAELAMKDKEISLNEFFQQLSSLATRYKFYSSSYSYLLLEIERRRKAELKLMSLRKDMLKVFEEAYGDELEERKSWSAQHGEYLPEVLCPFINDLPSKLTVAMESESGRLPVLSPESIDKALNEIHHTS